MENSKDLSKGKKNVTANETETANMQIDHIFNEEEDQFDLQNPTSLSRGNG